VLLRRDRAGSGNPRGFKGWTEKEESDRDQDKAENCAEICTEVSGSGFQLDNLEAKMEAFGVDDCERGGQEGYAASATDFNHREAKGLVPHRELKEVTAGAHPMHGGLLSWPKIEK